MSVGCHLNRCDRCNVYPACECECHYADLDDFEVPIVINGVLVDPSLADVFTPPF